MAEYIKRDMLCRVLERYQKAPKNRYQRGVEDGMELALSAVKAIHTADVAPVVHGRWMKRRNGGTLCNRCGHYTQYKGQVLDMSEAIACPWCGAKMDGGADHEAD